MFHPVPALNRFRRRPTPAWAGRSALTSAGREALAAVQPVVEAVVSTFFADHVLDEDLRHASRILDVLAGANPNDDGFDCGL
jgi:hypothetical protein